MLKMYVNCTCQKVKYLRLFSSYTNCACREFEDLHLFSSYTKCACRKVENLRQIFRLSVFRSNPSRCLAACEEKGTGLLGCH